MMENADTSALERDFGYKPSTSLREGLRKFAEWYAKFYKCTIQYSAITASFGVGQMEHR